MTALPGHCVQQPVQLRRQVYEGFKVGEPAFLELPRPCGAALACLLDAKVGCAVDIRLAAPCSSICGRLSDLDPLVNSNAGHKRAAAGLNVVKCGTLKQKMAAKTKTPRFAAEQDAADVVRQLTTYVDQSVLLQLVCSPAMPSGSSVKAVEAAQYPLFEDTFRASLSQENTKLDRYVRLPRAFALSAFAGAPGLEGWHAKMLASVHPAPNLDRFVGTLRPYQQEAVDHIVAKMHTLPCHSGILQGDCGCGKTLMGFNLMHRFRVPCMVIVHTSILMEQWQARLGEALPDAKIGILRAQDRPSDDADVCLAMVHTVIRLTRPEARKYRRYGLLLVDETHIIGARTFSTAVRLVCPPFVLGLSATPKRNDGLHAQVEWLTGPVLYRIDNMSTDVDVQPVRYTDARFEFAVHERRWDKRYGKVDSTATITTLMEDPARTAVLVALAREAVAEGRHALVLSERVQLLVAMEHALGKVCGRIQAGKSAKTIAGNEVAKTKQVVLASFKMAFVGLDIPRLDTLVFASPLKVREDFKQPIGRIQRGGTGMRARIYDFYDAAGYLLGYFAGRRSYYKKHQYTILPLRKFERLYTDDDTEGKPRTSQLFAESRGSINRGIQDEDDEGDEGGDCGDGGDDDDDVFFAAADAVAV